MINILLIILLLDIRHYSVVKKFKQLTGYPNGRPGYIVDHIIPLCAGGPDTVENLQWELRSESYIKDKYERALCRALKLQNLKIVPIQ